VSSVVRAVGSSPVKTTPRAMHRRRRCQPWIEFLRAVSPGLAATTATQLRRSALDQHNLANRPAADILMLVSPLPLWSPAWRAQHGIA
jgi:hypothetical protein